MINLPFKWKPIYTPIAGFIICALIIAGLSAAWVSKWADSRFDKKQLYYEQQLKTLATEREKAIARAELLERQAKELEGKIAINELIIKAAGARAEAAQKAVDDEEIKLQTEFVNIGADVPDDVRAERIRERLRRLYPK